MTRYAKNKKQPTLAELETLAINTYLKGEYYDSKSIFEYLISIGSQNPEIYLLLAFILASSSSIKASFNVLQKSLLIKNLNSLQLQKIGHAMSSISQYKPAINVFEKALSLDPNNPKYYFDIGNCYKALSIFDFSIVSYLKALELDPFNTEALNNLGTLYLNLGRIDEAIKLFKKAILINPYFLNSLVNLSNSLLLHLNIKSSIRSSNIALSIKPNSFHAIISLANGYIKCEQFEKALYLLKSAIKLNPCSPEALYNLGDLYTQLKSYQLAEKCYKSALKFKPDFPDAKVQLIQCELHNSNWIMFEERIKWLKNLGLYGEPVIPWGLMILEDNPYNHLNRTRRFSLKNFPVSSLIVKFTPKKKIRIGYFSSTFYEQAGMVLYSRIFQLHDKNKFEIYAYNYYSNITDRYTKRVTEHVDVYRDLTSIGDLRAAQIAREDNLDIAVDLRGYTSRGRFGIFANKVAPIQIHYMGFAGTTGSECIDYLIADRTIIPENLRKYYTENILYMPLSYQCNDETKSISTTHYSRSQLNLPEDSFVFTCFNSPHKITPREFDVWMKLLRDIPNSVLWLLETSPLSKNNLFREAKNRYISDERIIFAKKLPLEEHLARHSCGNLFLDTFNYNAHTTASDALFSGMPLLTLIGNSFSARVGASVLSALNMPELIAHNISDYYQKAYLLATNKPTYQRIMLKLKISISESSFFDSHKFTRDLEDHYLHVYNHMLKT